MAKINIVDCYNAAISRMGTDKFVTVVGGATCAALTSGLMVGLLLYNVIPNNPQIIETVTENIIEKENV